MRGLILALTICVTAMAFAFAVIPDADAAQVSKGVEEFSGSVRVGGILYADGNVIVTDDAILYLGDDLDVAFTYDETTDNRGEISGPVAFVTTTSDVEFLGGINVYDDKLFCLGTDCDASATYDETTDDRVEVHGDWTWGGGAGDTAIQFLDGISLPSEKAVTFGDGSNVNIYYDDAIDDTGVFGGDWIFSGVANPVGFAGGIGVTGGPGVVIGDNMALILGTDLDATCTYDETTDNRAECTGVWYFDSTGPVGFGAGVVVGDNVGAAFGSDSDWSCVYDETTSDDLLCTATAAASVYDILVGNFAVGNAVCDVAMDGEDACIEGTFEVDGAARFDGAVTLNSTVVAASTITSTGSTLGWTIVAGANTACTTTCGAAAAVHGWDTSAGEVVVSDTDATADKCLCAGAAS